MSLIKKRRKIIIKITLLCQKIESTMDSNGKETLLQNSIYIYIRSEQNIALVLVPRVDSDK